jgi:hypothetical protein
MKNLLLLFIAFHLCSCSPNRDETKNDKTKDTIALKSVDINLYNLTRNFVTHFVMVMAFDRVFNECDSIRASVNKIESTFNACYEGTQNTAVFNLRANGTFDVIWTGVIFCNLYNGNYTKNNDTILLNFQTEIPRQLGDTLIVKEGNLHLLQSDTTFNTHFYLGDCLGLN